MAKGYVIFTEDVHDKDGMRAYTKAAVPTVIEAGGKTIIYSDAEHIVEGEWHGNKTVVIEFESVEAAKAWYDSPEYQAVIGLRHAAAHTNVAIFAGLEMPG